MIGNKPGISHILSNNKSGIIATSYKDDAVSRGQAFEIKKRITLTTGQIYYLVIDSSALVSANKGFFIDPLVMSTGGGMVFVDTFAIDGYTGGEIVTPLKLNTTKAQTAECVFKKGVTIGNIISDPREYIVGTKSTNQSSGGGGLTIDVSKQFTSGAKIAAKLHNQETETVYLNFGIVFYEPQF